MTLKWSICSRGAEIQYSSCVAQQTKMPCNQAQVFVLPGKLALAADVIETGILTCEKLSRMSKKMSWYNQE